MKKTRILLLFCLLICSFNSFAQNKIFRLTGELDGLPDGTNMYLLKQRLFSKVMDTICRTKSKGISFGFEGSVLDDIGFYQLKTDKSDKASEQLVLINSDMQIKGDWQQWPKIELAGSVPHHEYIEVIALNSAMLKQAKAEELGKTEIDKKRVELFKSYINSHRKSLLSPYLVIMVGNSLKSYEMRKLYTQLGNDAKLSFYGKRLVEGIEVKANIAKIKVGKLIPDFMVKMADGSTTSVRKLAAKNKITLIDFWASWCSPCRMGFPHLKKMYNTYHPKGFGILGLSQDEKPEAWEKAMKEENTPWMNALDVEKVYKEIFMISAIPSYMMIDQEGKIISLDLFSSIPSGGDIIRGEYLEGTIKKLLKL